MASMWDTTDDAEFETEAPKRGRGRPKGSTSKSPETLLTISQLQRTYNRVKPLLSKKNREYYEGVISGDVDVDPLREMEVLVTLMGLIAKEASFYYLENPTTISRDYASYMNNLRMALTDLESIKAKALAREEKATKHAMVQLTEQGTEMDRLNRVISKYTTSGETGDS